MGSPGAQIPAGRIRLNFPVKFLHLRVSFPEKKCTLCTRSGSSSGEHPSPTPFCPSKLTPAALKQRDAGDGGQRYAPGLREEREVSARAGPPSLCGDGCAWKRAAGALAAACGVWVLAGGGCLAGEEGRGWRRGFPAPEEGASLQESRGMEVGVPAPGQGLLPFGGALGEEGVILPAEEGPALER